MAGPAIHAKVLVNSVIEFSDPTGTRAGGLSPQLVRVRCLTSGTSSRDQRVTALRRSPVAAGGAAAQHFFLPETVPGRVAPRWYRRRNRFEEESPR